jgi:hypothetical protein
MGQPILGQGMEIRIFQRLSEVGICKKQEAICQTYNKYILKCNKEIFK